MIFTVNRITSSTRLCVTTVPRPNQPPLMPRAFRSLISRSRVKPEITSVSPSTTRASMSDSITAGALTIGVRLNVRTESPDICAVTLKLIASVRTIDGSLFNDSSRGLATTVTVPCSPRKPRSFATSVTRKPFIVCRVGTGMSAVAAPLIFAATPAQSMPGAFASVGSTSMTRASICTCRCTRSCTASR